jgi:hypothetical protein
LSRVTSVVTSDDSAWRELALIRDSFVTGAIPYIIMSQPCNKDDAASAARCSPKRKVDECEEELETNEESVSEGESETEKKTVIELKVLKGDEAMRVIQQWCACERIPAVAMERPDPVLVNAALDYVHCRHQSRTTGAGNAMATFDAHYWEVGAYLRRPVHGHVFIYGNNMSGKSTLIRGAITGLHTKATELEQAQCYPFRLANFDIVLEFAYVVIDCCPAWTPAQLKAFLDEATRRGSTVIYTGVRTLDEYRFDPSWFGLVVHLPSVY